MPRFESLQTFAGKEIAGIVPKVVEARSKIPGKPTPADLIGRLCTLTRSLPSLIAPFLSEVLPIPAVLALQVLTRQTPNDQLQQVLGESTRILIGDSLSRTVANLAAECYLIARDLKPGLIDAEWWALVDSRANDEHGEWAKPYSGATSPICEMVGTIIAEEYNIVALLRDIRDTEDHPDHAGYRSASIDGAVISLAQITAAIMSASHAGLCQFPNILAEAPEPEPEIYVPKKPPLIIVGDTRRKH